MKAKERHDIKTDKFLDTVALVQEFLAKHGRTILFLLGAVIIVTVGWLGISWFLDHREYSAAESLNEALAVLDEALLTGEGDTTKLDEAETKLLEVVEKHGATASEIAARYYLGMIYIQKEDPEQARDQLQKVIDSHHPMYWELATVRLGYMLEGNGEFQEALDIYKSAAENKGSEFPSAYFAFKAGQCLEELGNKEEALSYYMQAKDSGELFHAGLDTTLEAKIDDLSKAIGNPVE